MSLKHNKKAGFIYKLRLIITSEYRDLRHKRRGYLAPTTEISSIESLFNNDDILLNLNLSGKYDPDVLNLFFKMERCEHLKEYLEEQKKIMNRHLNKHKWYQHIADPSKALEDFIEKYAWVMREMYCDKICLESKNCAAYQTYLKSIGEKTNENSADRETGNIGELCKI